MRAENVNDCVYDINPIDDAVYSKCMLEWFFKKWWTRLRKNIFLYDVHIN